MTNRDNQSIEEHIKESKLEKPLYKMEQSPIPLIYDYRIKTYYRCAAKIIFSKIGEDDFTKWKTYENITADMRISEIIRAAKKWLGNSKSINTIEVRIQMSANNKIEDTENKEKDL